MMHRGRGAPEDQEMKETLLLEAWTQKTRPGRRQKFLRSPKNSQKSTLGIALWKGKRGYARKEGVGQGQYWGLIYATISMLWHNTEMLHNED